MSECAAALIEKALVLIAEEKSIEEERIRQIVQEEVTRHRVIGTVNVQQASEYIGICTKTLYGMCQREEIDHLRLRGAIRFKYCHLDEYLDKQTVKARKTPN